MNSNPTSYSCRFCGEPLENIFLDLGSMPLANSYVSREKLSQLPVYPLTTHVCGNCFLVQLPAMETPENIFSDYAYFSSYSTSWLRHCEEYCGQTLRRLELGSDDTIIEVASNDGYLLQYFFNEGLNVMGIEPAANVAKTALKKGIPTRVDFFGSCVAHNLLSNGIKARLLIANNVLAHVPDLNDFVKGLKILLSKDGLLNVEFPHLLKLISQNQFDTIYHEHFSYFSLLTVIKIFSAHGLTVTDVEELKTHGGSLRIHAVHTTESLKPSINVSAILEEEKAAGLHKLESYCGFGVKAKKIASEAVDFLKKASSEGKKVVGYGAAAKANTFLNYSGINSGEIPFIADKSPHKQGLYMPGSGIPILSPEKIFIEKPDYVVIFPWNIKNEIIEELREIKNWGGRFVVFIPTLEIY